jgi:hypothetical protein
MENEIIAKIGINKSQELFITPVNRAFPFIYRTGIDVNWDEKEKYLFSKKPSEWKYMDLYKQILNAVTQEYGIKLAISSYTKWENIDTNLKEEIISFSKK